MQIWHHHHKRLQQTPQSCSPQTSTMSINDSSFCRFASLSIALQTSTCDYNSERCWSIARRKFTIDIGTPSMAATEHVPQLFTDKKMGTLRQTSSDWQNHRKGCSLRDKTFYHQTARSQNHLWCPFKRKLNVKNNRKGIFVQSDRPPDYVVSHMTQSNSSSIPHMQMGSITIISTNIKSMKKAVTKGERRIRLASLKKQHSIVVLLDGDFLDLELFLRKQTCRVRISVRTASHALLTVASLLD